MKKWILEEITMDKFNNYLFLAFSGYLSITASHSFENTHFASFIKGVGVVFFIAGFVLMGYAYYKKNKTKEGSSMDE